jgi:hypothetical protein
MKVACRIVALAGFSSEQPWLFVAMPPGEMEISRLTKSGFISGRIIGLSFPRRGDSIN